MNAQQRRRLQGSAESRRVTAVKSRRAGRGENSSRANNNAPESKQSDPGNVVSSSQLSDILSKIGRAGAPGNQRQVPSMASGASKQTRAYRQPSPDLTVFEIAAGLVPGSAGAGDTATAKFTPPPPPPPPPPPASFRSKENSN